MDYFGAKRKSLMRRWMRGWLLLMVPLLVAAGGGAWWGWGWLSAAKGDRGHTFVPVARGDLDLTINAAGRLEAMSNVDIMNPVAGRARIVEIVEEGKLVKKGDVICRMDATEWEQKVEEATIAVQGAEGEVTGATEQVAIQESENASKIETADVELRLAQLSHDEYMFGEFQQTHAKAKRAIEMAEIAVAKAQEEYQLAKVLNVQGFTTATELKEKHHEFVKAKGDLEEKQADLEVLLAYKHEKRRVELEDKLHQAKNTVERAQAEARSALTQKRSDLQSKEQKLMVLRQQLDFAKKQLESCVIKASADGMVVYGTSNMMFYGGQERMTIGSEIYQGQLLFRLPDTSRMKVIVPISEHKVAQVRVDENDPVTATVQVAGLKDSYSGRVIGKSVLPSNDMPWLPQDQKSYPVDVLLDETPPEVKPGTTARVNLKLRTLPDVLMLPTNCVYHRDGEAFVFLREDRPGGYELVPRKVEIGEASETHCEIVGGLSGGEMALALEVGQAGTLLEQAGITASKPSAPGVDAPADPAPAGEPAVIEGGTDVTVTEAAASS